MPVSGQPSLRAWLAWLAGSVFFFLVFVLRVSPSVMVDELMRDFTVGAAILGNLSAFYFYSYAALQIPVGVLMDHFGPRRLLTLSAAVCALGCVLFALAPSIELGYLGRFLIGAGAAFGWVGTLSIVGWHFPAERFASLAAGTQLIGMAGGVIGQAPLAVAIAAVGWRETQGWLAAAVAATALLLWFTVERRPARGAATPDRGLLHGLRTALASRQTWLNAVSGFTFAGPMLAFAALWGVPFLTTAYPLERGEAATLTSLVFIGWGVGGLVLSYLSDRRQRRRPFLVAGGLVMCASLTVAIYVPSLPPVVLGALLLAAGFGGSTAVLTFARVREQLPPHAHGAGMGIVNTAIMASGVVLQPLLGWLLELHWDGALQGGAPVYAASDYRGAFAIMPAGVLLGVICAWCGRDRATDPYLAAAGGDERQGTP